MSSARGPRVGIWGAFDVADYGNLLVPRIFENELRRRLPYAHVFPYAPLGAEHPSAMDGGRPAAPLGDWTPPRRAQLAEQFDLVAIGGDLDREPSKFLLEGLGEELERRCPVAWHAVGVPFELAPEEAARVRDAIESKRHVSVKSAVSRERLLVTGTERQIDVVPDPAILASRLLSDDTAERRLRYLRALKRYPAREPPLVLETSAALGLAVDEYTSAVSEARAHDPALPVVLVALSPASGDAELARTLASRLDDPVHELTEDVTLNDLVVAIRNGRTYCGASSAGCSTALAFGVPAVSGAAEVAALLRGEIALDPEAVRGLVERVDQHFDTLAAIAEESWSERLGPASAAELARALAEAERRHEALLRAYAERGERLLAEQERSAEMLDALEADEDAEGAARTRVELAEARNRLEVLDAELARVTFERDEAQ